MQTETVVGREFTTEMYNSDVMHNVDSNDEGTNRNALAPFMPVSPLKSKKEASEGTNIIMDETSRKALNMLIDDRTGIKVRFSQGGEEGIQIDHLKAEELIG